jgi:hypothetical protein
MKLEQSVLGLCCLDVLWSGVSEWVRECVNERECVSELVGVWVSVCVSEWVSECECEWVRECVNERECVSELVGVCKW